VKILYLDEIKHILEKLDPLPAIEKGFVQYSRGEVTVPPVGELLMDKGEVHIKYGCIRDDKFYTIKIASGFYGNAKLGLSTSNGLMLLFNQQNGLPECLLLDEGHLTNIRTAIAGAIAAKHLAPQNISAIGILGTGIQGRLQAFYLKNITPCREIIVWGREESEHLSYKSDMENLGFKVTLAKSVSDVMGRANLIVTTTPSSQALIEEPHVRSGMHITAMGSDTSDKQEVDSRVLTKADLIVADSISQCQVRGEIYQALKNKAIQQSDVVELGDVIDSGPGRTSEDQITIADLTGVAVQDIKIAEAVYESSLKT